MYMQFHRSVFTLSHFGTSLSYSREEFTSETFIVPALCSRNIARVSTRLSIFLRSIWSAECNVCRRPPSGRNVLSQPFFRILTPAADELTGYHLTVTTRDSCSLPFAGPALHHLPPPSSRALAHARPKNRETISCDEKKVKKPQASSCRTAGCCSVVETKGEPQSSTMYAWDRIDSVLSTISRIDYRVIFPSVFFATFYI